MAELDYQTHERDEMTALTLAALRPERWFMQVVSR